MPSNLRQILPGRLQLIGSFPRSPRSLPGRQHQARIPSRLRQPYVHVLLIDLLPTLASTFCCQYGSMVLLLLLQPPLLPQSIMSLPPLLCHQPCYYQHRYRRHQHHYRHRRHTPLSPQTPLYYKCNESIRVSHHFIASPTVSTPEEDRPWHTHWEQPLEFFDLFSNWAVGEGDNGNGDCMVTRGADGLWYQDDCNTPRPVICMYESE